MKKQLLFASAIVFASLGANSQDYYSFGAPKAGKMYDKKVENINHIYTNYKNSYNVIWEEDFETAGAASGGGIFETSNGEYTFDGDDSYWDYSNNPDWPINNNVQLEMNGTYMLWDSYNGVNEQDFSTTPVNGAIRTPSMDLSSASDDDLVMSFITSTMYCCHPEELPYNVSVSLDGGATFGDSIVFDFGVGRNDGTWNISSPLEFTVNLQDELDADPANNDNVVIEFRWVGDEIINYPSGNFQYNTMYFWAIDDIQIYEKPDHDLELEWAWTGNILNSLEQSEVPQSIGGNFVAQAKLNNLGRNIPTNVALEIEFENQSGVVESVSGGQLLNNFTLDSDTITFNTGIDISSLDIDDYVINYKVVFDETDENELNNNASRGFSVTDFTLANYNRDFSVSSSSPGFFFSPAEGESDPYQVGNVYIFDQDVTLHGVELSLSQGLQNDPTNTDEGAEVNIYIYEHNPDPSVWSYDYVAGPFAYEVTSDKIKTTAAGIFGDRHVYNLHQPELQIGQPGAVELDANTPYVIAFEHIGGPANHMFYWGTPFDQDFSTRIEGPFATGGNTGWFTFQEEPIMALNLDQTLNVSKEEELSENSVRIYPNPTSEIATIAYKLNGSSNVTIEVKDVTGKVIRTIDEGQKTQGTHNVELNTSGLANGVYNYSVVTDNARINRKFIKQ